MSPEDRKKFIKLFWRLFLRYERRRRLLQEAEKKRDQAQQRRDSYNTRQAAARLDLSSYTVRQKCSLGELLGKKIEHGAGSKGEWRIEDAEIERYLREGPRKPKY